MTWYDMIWYKKESVRAASSSRGSSRGSAGLEGPGAGAVSPPPEPRDQTLPRPHLQGKLKWLSIFTFCLFVCLFVCSYNMFSFFFLNVFFYVFSKRLEGPRRWRGQPPLEPRDQTLPRPSFLSLSVSLCLSLSLSVSLCLSLSLCLWLVNNMWTARPWRVGGAAASGSRSCSRAGRRAARHDYYYYY